MYAFTDLHAFVLAITLWHQNNKKMTGLIVILLIILVTGYLVWQQWNDYKSALTLIENGEVIKGNILEVKEIKIKRASYYITMVKFIFFGKTVIGKNQICSNKIIRTKRRNRTICSFTSN